MHKYNETTLETDFLVTYLTESHNTSCTFVRISTGNGCINETSDNYIQSKPPQKKQFHIRFDEFLSIR